MKRIAIGLTVVLLSTFFACNEDGTGVFLFSIEDDKNLGLQLRQEIFNSPNDYPLLDTVAYASAYRYIRGLKDSIINTGAVTYADEFAWEVYIIENDSVLNAFAAPGGYLYFYTGLIKFLDEEDDLMGVMGHEIAHADRRHSVKQMQQRYGVSILLSIALGNQPSQVAEILGGLAGNLGILKFSRDAETEADLFSVEYLSHTAYRCDGAATFFKKLSAQGAVGPPVFLSTHPSPTNRVEQIGAEAMRLGCDTTYYAPSSYDVFRNSLP